jgi:hypothetical protein
VRIRASATPYFDRTPASTSGNNTWTFSCWVKRGSDIGSTSTQESIMGAGDGGGAPARYDVFGFYNDTIQFFTFNGSAASIYTTAVFRDPSAWYHLVCRYDDTQSTASNRVRIYVNGVLQTLNSPTYPNQNYGSNFNTTYLQHIAANTIATNRGIDGYLAEVIMVSGQSLDPSSFGQTDTITGSWVAKKYTGTYGTNGFYLNFSDNSAATSTTIGKDYSGNGNNWTPNNISVTAGSTYDSMLDVPSGSGYADGGNGRGNYATLNPLDTATSSTLTNGNLTNTLSTGSGSSQASTVAMTSGKWYWEVSESSVTNQSCGVGILRANLPATVTRDSNPGGVYYVSGGSKFIDGTNTSYGTAWGSTGVTYVIGVALDLDAGTVTFYLNNTSQGAITLPSNTYGWRSHAIWSSASGTGTFETNFGQRPFSYTPPTGFKALNTINLSDPTIKKGSSYFDVVTRAGTAATANITSLSFQPDFVWFKSRGRAVDHALYDSVRGVEKRLETNNTDAEVTGDTTGLTAFNSNGYTIGALDQINGTTATNSFVDWAWKANGAGVSNTAGTITSTVSANTTSGFSIVTWTGNGSASATVGHGLGVAPSMVIAKERTGTDYWHVWHTTLPNQQLYLNVTNAAVSITSGAPGPTDGGLENMTTSTFGFKTSSGGNVNSVNENGILNVAYCFAAISGYSKFGSYTGNGSTDGPFCYTGFQPKYILYKRSDSTGDWYVWDTARDTVNVVGNGLFPNYSVAEVAYGTILDIVSNGFKLRTNGIVGNASGATYIYAAFATSPFKFSNGR